MPEEEISIRALLHQCLNSTDERQWCDFVRRTQPMIANVIINTFRNRCEPNTSLVDDLIQETFLKLFANDRKALRSIKNEYENTIFGYLKVVASNVAYDYLRNPDNKVLVVSLDDAVVPPFPDGLDRIAFNRLKDRIQTQLRTLSSTTRERDESIFWLYYEQGYTAKEIADIPAFGLTIKGVESTLLRLKHVIRDSGLASETG